MRVSGDDDILRALADSKDQLLWEKVQAIENGAVLFKEKIKKVSHRTKDDIQKVWMAIRDHTHDFEADVIKGLNKGYKDEMFVAKDEVVSLEEPKPTPRVVSLEEPKPTP